MSSDRVGEPAGQAIIEDYLSRLDRAAFRLPPERRTELLDGISEHIRDARAGGGVDGQASVRSVLDRLGEPEEIVAAAWEQDAPSYGGPGHGGPGYGGSGCGVVRQPGTGLELAAVLMLTLGSLIPVVGWLVGVALLWSSRLLRVPEKVLGTLIIPGGPGLLLVVGALASDSTTSCSSGGTFDTGTGAMTREPTTCTTRTAAPLADIPPALLLLALALSSGVAFGLYLVARRRAAALPPKPVDPHGWGGLEIAGVLVLGLGACWRRSSGRLPVMHSSAAHRVGPGPRRRSPG